MAVAQLEVQPQNILVKDKELAIQLCNIQGDNEFWLCQDTNKFFTENEVPTTGRASFLFEKHAYKMIY